MRRDASRIATPSARTRAGAAEQHPPGHMLVRSRPAVTAGACPFRRRGQFAGFLWDELFASLHPRGVREQKLMRAQRATLIQVGSCRVTNALLLLLAQALHFLLQEALALLLLGVLGALLPVQLKHSISRLPAHQQPAHALVSPVSRLTDGSPAPGRQIQVLPTSIDQQVQLHGTTYAQNEQTGGTEVDRQGCRKEKCREALCSRLLLLPLLVVVPGSRWMCPEWCARRCCSKSFMIKTILKSAAAISSMARPAWSL